MTGLFAFWVNGGLSERHAIKLKSEMAGTGICSGEGGIPVGVKLSAQIIERDIEAALQIGFDFIKTMAPGS